MLAVTGRSIRRWGPRIACAIGAVAALLLSAPLSAQSYHIRNYSIDDGLGASQVWSIYQDRRGVMWFGTTNGVTRYDGHSFRTIGLRDGLPDPLVRTILEAPDGSLWFGTNAGVALYDGKTIRAFTEADGLGKGPVWSSTVDAYGHIWFATQEGGVSVFDGKAFHSFAEREGLAAGFIYSIYSDSKGDLWTGTREGSVTRFSPRSDGTISQVRIYRAGEGLPRSPVRAITEDRDGNIYFGTRGAGVVRFDGTSFTQFGKGETLPGADVYALTMSSRGELVVGMVDGGVAICGAPKLDVCRWIGKKNGLNVNGVYSLFEDREQTLWIGLNNGLAKLLTESFLNFGDHDGLVSSTIHSIVPEASGDVWIGTSEGITRLRATGHRDQPWATTNLTMAEGLPSNGVWDVVRTRDGTILVGTRGGLAKLRDGRVERVYTKADGLPDDFVDDVFEDSNGFLWVGTSAGVAKLDLRGPKPVVQRFTMAEGVSSNVVYCVAEDHEGRIWMATATNGVDVWDGRRFRNYSLQQGLESKAVNEVYVSSDGTVWAGTSGGGLAKFDRANDRFVSFGAAAGLTSDSVAATLEATDGMLWLGTSGGVFIFDPKLGGGRVVRHLTKQSGLAGNEMLMNGALAFDTDGNVWMGFSQGATLYRLGQDVRTKVQSPPAMIDRVVIGSTGRALAVPFAAWDATGALDWIGDGIELAWSENRVVVHFRGLSYDDERDVRYQYQLVGFDSDWSVETAVPFKEYTNLDPGNYTFQVRARSREGGWSAETSQFSFVVLAPWWMTIWARLLALLLVAIFVFAYARLRTRRVERTNRALQALVEERTEELKEYSRRLESHARELQTANERSLEANRTKSRFLATMSHELRTPLNSIIGFSEILNERLAVRVGARELGFLRNILDSGHHLLNLINNLLDLSKIEAGRMEVHAEPILLVELISSVRSVLVGMASRKGIEVVANVDDSVPVIFVDGPKVRQILYNLVSNAIKFSPDKGRVEIEACALDAGSSPLTVDSVKLTVRDEGAGIPRELQEMIFEEFRQTDEGSVLPGGTGLGLAIVRKLVEIQGGVVGVESESGKGSLFRVVLPVEITAHHFETREVAAQSDGGARPTVLIVEDDAEFRAQLVEQLDQAGYATVWLGRGEDALKTAEELQPSVIMLDVMLPGIDGWEVLRRLKASARVGAVPVVIVTAAANHELGIALGADDVLTKPVDGRRLLARVRQLAPTEASDGGATVLVIDDDAGVHAIVRASVAPAGYQVISAESGETGLELASTLAPSVIVLDLMMPEINGFEVATRLQHDPATASIPLLVLTSMDLTAADRARLAGKMSALLSKGNARPATLLDTIRRLERRKGRIEN
ncbi:MAG: two-component regulator propeller domain-containing protein [Thermoanaerobaculia bacterium]|jgi:signal transduction histidine kinase/ligand-binding sensor domain-containing protein/DNA-binding response OmpR family regulator